MKLFTSYAPYIKAAYAAIREHRKETEIPYLMGYSPFILNIDFKKEYGFEFFVQENGLPYFETDMTASELVEKLKRWI